jgi:hypothetical protein
MMGGSLFGLEHLYAQARQQDFVREAERLEAVRVAESRQARYGGTRVDRVRRIAGSLLILLGERVRGARPGESVTGSGRELPSRPLTWNVAQPLVANGEGS